MHSSIRMYLNTAVFVASKALSDWNFMKYMQWVCIWTWWYCRICCIFLRESLLC